MYGIYLTCIGLIFALHIQGAACPSIPHDYFCRAYIAGLACRVKSLALATQ